MAPNPLPHGQLEEDAISAALRELLRQEQLAAESEGRQGGGFGEGGANGSHNFESLGTMKAGDFVAIGVSGAAVVRSVLGNAAARQLSAIDMGATFLFFVGLIDFSAYELTSVLLLISGGFVMLWALVAAVFSLYYIYPSTALLPSALLIPTLTLIVSLPLVLLYIYRKKKVLDHLVPLSIFAGAALFYPYLRLYKFHSTGEDRCA